MRVAIASGKGGTGKTLLATNLAWLLSADRRDVTYVDVDVEAPNGALFLTAPSWDEERFGVAVPALREGHCSGCGACQEHCAFHAILAVTDKVLVFPELCHACGGCLRICAEGALYEVPREVGTIFRGQVGALEVLGGRLDIGEVRAVPLIEAALAASPESGVVVVDAPPGTSCNAVAAVRGADLVLLVTEPTPFGLHDLRLAVEMCESLGARTAAVINRSDLGAGGVRDLLRARGIPLLAEIPLDRDIADAYAFGELAVETVPHFRRLMEHLAAGLVGGRSGEAVA